MGDELDGSVRQMKWEDEGLRDAGGARVSVRAMDGVKYDVGYSTWVYVLNL